MSVANRVGLTIQCPQIYSETCFIKIVAYDPGYHNKFNYAKRPREPHYLAYPTNKPNSTFRVTVREVELWQNHSN